MKFTRCGLDIAKQVFQVHGVNEHGVVKGRKRLARAKVLEFLYPLSRKYQSTHLVSQCGANPPSSTQSHCDSVLGHLIQQIAHPASAFKEPQSTKHVPTIASVRIRSGCCNPPNRAAWKIWLHVLP